MNCFIIPRKPKSYNNWKLSDPKAQAYLKDILKAFVKFYPNHKKLVGDLYGTIYYFYRNFHEGKRQDADNISKPVWDCLTNILYLDDKQVRLRVAGIVDLEKENIMQWNLPPAIIEHFISAVDNYQHFIYVECGNLTGGMYQFNLEPNEN